MKAAILKEYDINPETYRQRFRSLDVESEESPKEQYVRELIGMEQFLRMLSPELQVWVKEHGVKSLLKLPHWQMCLWPPAIKISHGVTMAGWLGKQEKMLHPNTTRGQQ